MALESEKNQEIDAALKEFETKATVEQASSPQVVASDDAPRMVRWVMKLSGGAITEQKQAEYVLLGFAILIFGISLLVFFKQ